MPQLSIIIVSYNCKTVLSLCLESLVSATKNLDTELIIIDNASIDGTPEMVGEYYPQIKLIRNKENLGFAKSNNIGIRKSGSDKILLLNPDTIVFSSSLKSCISILEKEAKTAAVGVRMIDACGGFLPESKRGVPTPWRSFSKLSGLWRISPRSKSLAGYYWGWLNKMSSEPVEILSGAFLIFDRGKLGADFLLDESFFMFGEDIDFSYRILKKGYQNKYLGDVFIVHFKGESSDKSDPVYLNNFYGAMQLFSQKHFGGAGLGNLYKAGIKILRFLSSGSPNNDSEKRIKSIDTSFVNEDIANKAIQSLDGPINKEGGDWMVLDSSSPNLEGQFHKLSEINSKGTIIWENQSRAFFVSAGKGERGWLVKAE